MTGQLITVTFTHTELEDLKQLLVEKAHEMDDDGNEGAFDASCLKPLYDKVRGAIFGKVGGK